MRNLFGESTLNYLIKLATDSLWVFVFHSDGSRFIRNNWSLILEL